MDAWTRWRGVNMAGSYPRWTTMRWPWVGISVRSLGYLAAEVIDEELRVLAVHREHLEMSRYGQAWFDGAGQVDGFLIGHIADAVGLEPFGIAAVDGQESQIKFPTAQQALHAFVDAGCRQRDRGENRCLR